MFNRPMFSTRNAVAIIPIALVVLGSDMVSSQDYPNKPIRIFTGSVGSGNDVVSRQLAQGISGALGQPVIIENRGGGTTSAIIVSKAPPDGYTLLAASVTHWTTPLLQKTPYDPLGDFSPISMLAQSPNIFAVHPSLPVKSVKELIALAKAKPGELNYYSIGTGGSSHLYMELFKSLANVNIVRISYSSNGPALNALLSGEVQLTVESASPMLPHVKSGKVRALAITSARPSALVPGIPTVAESGLAGYVAASSYAIFAPTKTPATAINRLNQEIVRALNQSDLKEKLFKASLEVVGSSPEELGATIKAEMSRLGKVIKDAGITAE